MGIKKNTLFTFSDGLVWLPDFNLDRETYELLSRAAQKSGRTKPDEGLFRLKDHLLRFSLISTEGVVTYSSNKTPVEISS